MYDFVVVGVGPPGARFARRAAEEGYDVLALEKGQIGEPLACSGHVSTDVWEFTGPGAREELFQNEIYGARFHVGGPESDGYPFYKQEVASNVIDRVGLDRHLADLAREAGADVREEHTVTEITEHRDRVDVTANGPDGVVEFEAKMLAGCDGARSRVRDALDLPEPDELLHGVLAFSDEEDHQNFVDVHLTAPTFFAWRIPRGDAGVEYGLAAPPGVQVTKHFEELIDGYEIDVSHRCSGPIPIGPPDRVTTRRAFLIGDAAAQTKPFTGGGILYSMTSADYAVREINPDRPTSLAAYERAWREDLEREQELGHYLRRAYSLPEPVQHVGLGALSGEIGVHMDRPTSLVSPSHLRAMLSRLR
ncbi:geranylgeranyl reductase family protein [Natronolimnohabitans innermongolicus]|uniref:Geranylgeranyl reductase n=1 Tax=Natronolimnohabitans innermongolicus JCM 12255 TaxID=1227499 RepID=L9WZA1_9EURY|nr:geranylgeranyl reductase family protein [Natronolimnohabitans innermongolicus]ELY53683.1 geranylgeranyl reductase [Natronolimnohabitans innermongolicus JCM 12255]